MTIKWLEIWEENKNKNWTVSQNEIVNHIQYGHSPKESLLQVVEFYTNYGRHVRTDIHRGREYTGIFPRKLLFTDKSSSIVGAILKIVLYILNLM
jgi:hypothetical protein